MSGLVVAGIVASFQIAGLTPLPAKLPAKCAALAVPPASAKISAPAFAAHISVANCLAEIEMNTATVTPDLGSIERLDKAVAPALAILDNVILVGDPYARMTALDAKRDLYVSVVVRERSSETREDAASRARLELAVAPWLADATDTIVAMTELAHQHPQLVRRDSFMAGVVARIPADRAATSATASRLP